MKEKLRRLTEKQKWRELVASISAIQEILKGVPQAEMKGWSTAMQIYLTK